MKTINKLAKFISNRDYRWIILDKYGFYRKMNSEKYLSQKYMHLFHKELNLQTPITLNEKLNWYKLHYFNPLMVKCVDKILVDEYIRECGFEEILTKKIKIWDTPEEVDIETLPKEFVIKTNHDSGGVYICRDKSKFDKSQLERIKKSFYKEFSNSAREWPYTYVEKKVFAEELIQTSNGHAPIDYKFFCFNGEPSFLYVGSERDVDVKFDFFDIDWNWFNVRQGHLNAKIVPSKPDNYEKMLDICRIISKPFPHVRVDLYNIDGNIRFGELTFFHFGGLVPFEPDSFDASFGKWFDIEAVKRNEYYTDNCKEIRFEKFRL